MKKLFILLASVTFLLLQFPKQSSATHYAGCDLTYVCLGGNDYLITVTFFRDCSGAMPTNTIDVDFNSSCFPQFTSTFNLKSGYPVNISLTCIDSLTTCDGGFYYGLQKWVYEKQVVLAPCSDWVISWESGNRNWTDNLLNPLGQFWYIYANLNNAAAPCNSSPQFTNDPAVVMCANQFSCFNHGASDPDGDSLTYSLVAPMQYATTPVVYITTTTVFSATNPLPSVPPVSVDPNTGDVCMNPTQTFIAAMAVKIEEWRHINGVITKVGTTVRDMQIKIVTCNNLVPTVAGINPAATQYSVNDSIYTLAVCLGDTIDFNVYSHDADVSDTLTMSWNGGIPNGSWSVTGNGTTNPVGHFFWVPTGGFVSNVSQCFTVNIQDNACPYIGQQTKSYCITVKGIDVKMDPPSDTTLCLGESYQIVALGDTNVVNYTWKVDGVVVIPTINDSTYVINTNTLGAGVHTVTCIVDDGTTTVCPGLTQVNVTVVPLPNVNLGADQIGCNGQAIVLDAGPGQLFSWQPGLQNTQTINVTSPGVYSVTVDGGFYTRCMDSDTVQVNFQNMPTVDLGHDTCVTSPITLDAGNPGYLYLWNTGATTQTITADHSGEYIVNVYPQSENNCNDRDTIKVLLNPLPTLSIGTDTVTCSHQKFIMTAKDVDGYFNDPLYSYTFHWEPSGENTRSITLSCLEPGMHEITLSVGGCTIIDTVRKVESQLCQLQLPNVITPGNNDGKNDKFKIEGVEFFPNSTMQIFNRWGKKIFESKNYNDENAWDGGSEADGVYYYVLTVNYGDQNSCMEARNYNGTVTIIR